LTPLWGFEVQFPYISCKKWNLLVFKKAYESDVGPKGEESKVGGDKSVRELVVGSPVKSSVLSTRCVFTPNNWFPDV
jgi:hypothetical protein